jgi:hypothetical protein
MSTTLAVPKIMPTVENLFILTLKEGNFVNQYNILATDLQEGILKGKKYCDTSGSRKRFIHVRPFLTDLERKPNEENKSS